MGAKTIQASQKTTFEIPREFELYAKELALLTELAQEPPQSLLIEGGDERARYAAAIYWALLANCPTASHARPCLNCSICHQILAKEHQDILMFDGRISNRQDEENPASIRALNMGNMRSLKSLLGVSPRSARKRIILIDGMTSLREEALNSLLKVLEEPQQQTLFALLTPVREQILPTLVSRSMCFTLPWNMAKETKSALQQELGSFLLHGKGFLGSIAQKGMLEDQTAHELLFACQDALLHALRSLAPQNDLELFFARVGKNPALCVQTQQWINEALEMLILGVNPVRCLEGFATRLNITAQKNSN